MNCIAHDRKGAELLLEYCAGTLDPVQAAVIEEHTRDCGECRRLVDAQRSVWQGLDAWKPIEVSSDFDARLYARIAQVQAEPWWYRAWKPALSIAAVAAMAAFLIVGRTETKVTVPVAPAVQAQHGAQQSPHQAGRIDIQEVQQALDDLDVLTPAANAPSPL
jgi:anti-sigma factor RsiW